MYRVNAILLAVHPSMSAIEHSQTLTANHLEMEGKNGLSKVGKRKLKSWTTGEEEALVNAVAAYAQVFEWISNTATELKGRTASQGKNKYYYLETTGQYGLSKVPRKRNP